ncbi:hypothetical protein [Streptomyces sp. EN23]|uniref:hypothetical protein n=1 Tax=Streptomyces sp. EN23 TaxID=212774 RepID=UPI000851F045|nr:hypothetical protein [Streptomyces sp. EN23]
MSAGSVTSSRTTSHVRDVVASQERKARASSSGRLPAVPGAWTSAAAWAYAAMTWCTSLAGIHSTKSVSSSTASAA